MFLSFSLLSSPGSNLSCVRKLWRFPVRGDEKDIYYKESRETKYEAQKLRKDGTVFAGSQSSSNWLQHEPFGLLLSPWLSHQHP